MQITDDLFEKLAKLSKLEFSADEKAGIQGGFQQMLDFVNQLQEVDTTGVEPLIHMTEEVNRFRKDEPQLELKQEATLRNAPDHDGGYFRVPKVVNK